MHEFERSPHAPAPHPLTRRPLTHRPLTHRPLTHRRALAAALAAAAAGALLAACDAPTPADPATTAAAGGPRPCGSPQPGPARDGVRITAVGPACARFEVSNPDSEPSDVTVLFTRLSAGGGALENLPRTVTAVPAGATAQGELPLGPAGSGAPRLAVTTVRRVPTAEAPQPGGPCPASGVRVFADQADAAMGLREVGLHLRNCGTAPVTVDGYPQLQLLDLDHRPVDGISVLPGGAPIATGTGADAPPQRLTLGPGQGARAGLVWRSTAGDGTPVNVPYVRIRAYPGAAPVMITPDLDLGTTGRLGAGAWAREDGQQ